MEELLSLFSFDMVLRFFLDKAAITDSLSQNHILHWINLVSFSVSVGLLLSRRAKRFCALLQWLYKVH